MTSVPAMVAHLLLDIQVGDEAGVLLDELAARLDLVAHEHREQLRRGQRVVHVDLLQRPAGRVHRRLVELLGVHLAEALEARELDPLLGDAEHGLAQRLEGQRLLAVVLLERHGEGRRAGELDELPVHAHERAVLLGVEQRLADAVRPGEPGPGLDGAHDDERLVLVLDRRLEGLALETLAAEQLARQVDRRDALVEQRGLLEEHDEVVAVRGAQRRRPPLVLLEQAREALPAVLGELELLALGVEHREALELVAEQHLLELGLVLEVAVVLALRELVERRLGDVDVAGLDQLVHLAEQQREDQRADVRAVHVGVRHEDHLVIAGLLEVELLADARAHGGDERLDLVVLQDLVDPRLLDVEDLAAQRGHSLRVAVAALLGRAGGGVALDHEQLGERRVLDRAVGELSRERRVLQRAFLPRGDARLARSGTRLRRLDGLAHDGAALLVVLLEELREAVVDDVLHEAGHARVAELGLRLALELRVGELDRDDGRQTLAHVLAGEVLVLLLELPALAREAVERARQRRAGAAEVGAALVRVDVVGEREDGLLVGGVPLHGDLDHALLALGLEVDDLLADRVLVLVEVVDEVADAALVVELDLAALATLVGERDLQALREVRGLTQALLQGGPVEVEGLEDLGVGREGDRRAGGLGLFALLQLAGRRPARVLLRPEMAVAADLDAEVLAERVDHRDADAVQAARDLVAAAVAELAAGVQDGEHDLDGRALLLLVHRHRDAAAVVDDRDRVVRVDDDVDPIAVAGEGLVDRVVDDLPDEVVKAADPRRADVHARTLAHRLEALEDGDVLCVV